MNDEAVLEITGLAHDGRGIARLGNASGLAVFVSGALPGMVAACRMTRRKKNLAEAVALEIIRPLPAPGLDCPHAKACGGCPLIAMPYPDQLVWKERLVRDAMRKIGGIGELELKNIWRGLAPSPEIRAMRNKMEFAFAGAGAGLRIGLRKAASHEVTSVPGCLLMPPEAGEIIALIRDLSARRGLCAYDGHGNGLLRGLTLRRGFTVGEDKLSYFVLFLTQPCRGMEAVAIRELGHELMKARPDLAGFEHETSRAPGFSAHGGKRVFSLGQSVLELPLAGRRYRLDISSFFQVNTGGAQILAELACSMLSERKGGSLLDLFCGVGAPGQTLARHFDSLSGIERDEKAIAMARLNARTDGLERCRYKSGDAQEAPGGGPGRHACVLLDPPRAGLAPRLVQNLCASRPASIIYISCNPSTLARDIAALKKSFRLRALGGVDLFPHSAHAECVAALEAIDGPERLV